MTNRVIFLCFSVLSLFAFFIGCTPKEKQYGDFIYDIDHFSTNLDPQTASDYEAHLVLSNTMEGLLRFGLDGEPEKALAKDYTISEDNLTYTFTLRPGLHWSDWEGKEKGAIAADDFVFALERILDPATGSPYRGQFLAIQNATSIGDGTLPPSALGVRALNSTTLEIILSSPDKHFLEALSSPAAFPCNRSFFDDTAGTYGLSKEALLYSGSYYLTTWRSDRERFGLIKSPLYYSYAKVKANTVIFQVQPDPVERFSRFQNGDTDAILLSGDAIRQVNLKEYPEVTLENNTTWSVLINHSSPLFQNLQIRQAFWNAVSPSEYSDSLPSWMTPTLHLIPPSAAVKGLHYLEQTQQQYTPPGFSATDPKQLLQEGLATLNLPELPKITLYYPEGEEYTITMQRLQKLWQNKLAIYPSIVPLPLKELKEKVASGSYEMAFLPLTSDTSDPYSYLARFHSLSPQNTLHFQSPAFDQLLEESQSTFDPQTQLALYAQAEALLFADAALLPIANQSTYFIENMGRNDIFYQVKDHMIFFSKAYKKE